MFMRILIIAPESQAGRNKERVFGPSSDLVHTVKSAQFSPMCTVSSMMVKEKSQRGETGSSLVEFVLLFPILFFLFVGVFDMGMFSYALIAVENAARVAALDTSASSATSGSTSLACKDVLKSLQQLPNHAKLPSSCTALPLSVTAAAVTGPDGNAASKVTVSYQSAQLIPVPGLTGRLSITRVVQMRVRG